MALFEMKTIQDISEVLESSRRAEITVCSEYACPPLVFYLFQHSNDDISVSLLSSPVELKVEACMERVVLYCIICWQNLL